jgi:hypothetical protein
LDVDTKSRNGTIVGEGGAVSWKRLIGMLAIATATGLDACGGGGGSGGGSMVPTLTVSSVAVTGNLTLTQGQTSQLIATATLSNGTSQDVTAMSTWTSSQPAVASVSSGGLVTAVSVGSANITATYQNVSSSARAMQVNAQPVHADFTVTPDAGTNVQPGQCAVSEIGQTQFNALRCTFDATNSTPNGASTTYTWEIPAGAAHFSGPVLKGISVGCGFLAVATDKPVKLTVTAPMGSDTITRTVTFVKVGAC